MSNKVAATNNFFNEEKTETIVVKQSSNAFKKLKHRVLTNLNFPSTIEIVTERDKKLEETKEKL